MTSELLIGCKHFAGWVGIPKDTIDLSPILNFLERVKLYI